MIVDAFDVVAELDRLLKSTGNFEANTVGSIASEALHIFHCVCVLRADGAVFVGNRNVFLEANDLFYYYYMNERQKHNLDQEMWSDLLGIELDEVMHAVLLREDFLEENITDIGRFLYILGCVIERFNILGRGAGRERESAALLRADARVAISCEYILRHRQRFSDLWAPVKDPEHLARGAHILPLIIAYLRCASSTANDTPPVSLLKLFLTIWASCSEQLPLVSIVPAFQFHAQVFFLGADAKNAGFIRTGIIESIGPDVWFERVLQDVQLDNISCHYRGTLLQLLNSIGLHPLMVSYFNKHPCLDAIATVLQLASSDPDQEARAWVCDSASWVVNRCVSEYFYNRKLSRPVVFVPGSLPVVTLARVVHVVADDCPRYGDQERTILHELIGMFTNIIRARDDRVYVRKFVAQMKTTARIEWWPNLARLQAAHYRVREDRVLNLLVHFWGDFGVACGLDEEKERRRHRREGRAFCSWAACEYSMQKPPGKLLSCRACGEAQYCGRDCQRKDWNQGGHKKHCGRRLKA